MKCKFKSLKHCLEQKIISFASKVAINTIERCYKLKKKNTSLLSNGKKQKKLSFNYNVERKIYNSKRIISMHTARKKKIKYRIKGKLFQRRRVILKGWNYNIKGRMLWKNRNLHLNLPASNPIFFRENKLLIFRKKK